MIDQKIGDFDEAVRFLKKHNQGIPQLYVFDLSTAKTDFELTFTGSMVYMWDATDNVANISVKFNQKDGFGIPLLKQQGIRTPFDRIFITHDAQAAKTVTLLIGTLSPEFLDVIDNRAVVSADLAEVRDQLEGDTSADEYDDKAIGTSQSEIVAANSDRHGFICQADISNTDYIYLGFDNLVTSTKAFAKLTPGQSFSIDNYRGAIHCISGATSQKIFYGEW